MIYVSTPADTNDVLPKNRLIFLAGGISNCVDWQKEVIDGLKAREEEFKYDWYILNPRCDSFDGLTAAGQVKWEYEYLNTADIFSMFFAGGESVQPICMYELGRYVEVFRKKYINWTERLVITCDEGYIRADDVVLQMHCVANDHSDFMNELVARINRPLTVKVEEYEKAIQSHIDGIAGAISYLERNSI